MSDEVRVTFPLRAELGNVAEVFGRLARVITINDGHEITFEYIGSEPCPTCGRPDRVSINEGCPLWEESVKPIETCGSSKLHVAEKLA